MAEAAVSTSSTPAAPPPSSSADTGESTQPDVDTSGSTEMSSAAPAEPPKKKWKLPSDKGGPEEEVDEDELLRRAKKARFYEKDAFAKHKELSPWQEFQKVIDSDDPDQAVAALQKKLGADKFHNWAVRYMEKVIERLEMDPEKRAMVEEREQIAEERRQIEAELSRQKLPAAQLQAALQQAAADLLRDRIDQMLLVQKAKDLNITVDQDLSKYMAQLQLESKITDPDKFLHHCIGTAH